MRGTIRTIIGVGAVVTLLMSDILVPQVVLDVKSGEKTLECFMSDGYRVIDGSKVVDLDDVSMRWVFTNGSAKISNCEVY